MDYDELCKKVLELDSEIRFTGVVNNKGELLSGGPKEGIEVLLKPDEVKMSIHYSMERSEKVQNLAYKIGNEKSNVSEYEKVTLITIPIENKQFLLSVAPGIDYYQITNKVQSLIGEATKNQ